MFAALKALSAYNLDNLHATVAKADQAHQRTVTMLIALLVALTVLAVLLGFSIARAISRPLGEATRVAGAIAPRQARQSDRGQQP